MSARKYNSLDNQKMARDLRTQLILERADIRQSLQYEHATSYCSDCPNRERVPQSYEELEFGVHYAPECCKDNGAWVEWHENDYKTVDTLTIIIEQITAYLGEDGVS